MMSITGTGKRLTLRINTTDYYYRVTHYGLILHTTADYHYVVRQSQSPFIPFSDILKKGIRFPGFLIPNCEKTAIWDKNCLHAKPWFIPFFDILKKGIRYR